MMYDVCIAMSRMTQCYMSWHAIICCTITDLQVGQALRLAYVLQCVVLCGIVFVLYCISFRSILFYAHEMMLK